MALKDVRLMCDWCNKGWIVKGGYPYYDRACKAHRPMLRERMLWVGHKDMNDELIGGLTAVFGEPIYTYTRDQKNWANEDIQLRGTCPSPPRLIAGGLVDVTEWASSTKGFRGGYTIPVAMTAALWRKVEAPKGSHQDTRGRAHDVLWMSSLAVKTGHEFFRVILGRGYQRLRVVIDGDGATIGYPEDF